MSLLYKYNDYKLAFLDMSFKVAISSRIITGLKPRIMMLNQVWVFLKVTVETTQVDQQDLTMSRKERVMKQSPRETR